jgi:hypothetical protein
MSEDEKISAFENAIEIVLEAQPEAVLPVIRNAANELKFNDGYYYSDDLHAEGDVTASIDRCAIGVSNKKKMHSQHIGVITLQPFPDNRTLFRVPPFSKQERDKYWELDPDGAFFTEFLRYIFSEFQRLGFIDFKKEKPPIGFKPPHKEKNA